MGEDQCEYDPSVLLLLLLQFQVSGPQSWFSLEERAHALTHCRKFGERWGKSFVAACCIFFYVHIHINQLGEHTDPSLHSSVVSGSFELLSSVHRDEQTLVPT